jgi:hypothetical protein
VGEKDRCGSHTAHDWSTPRKQDADFDVSEIRHSIRRIDRFELSKGNRGCHFQICLGSSGLGISIPHKISPTARAADVLDRFSTLSVQKKTAQIADEKFEAVMGQLEDVCFVNGSVDLGTIHGLSPIHCVFSNPFLLARHVLFDLQERIHFRIEKYASLSETIVLRLTRKGSTMLIQDPRRANPVVSALLIDSLRAQSSG